MSNTRAHKLTNIQPLFTRTSSPLPAVPGSHLLARTLQTHHKRGLPQGPLWEHGRIDCTCVIINVSCAVHRVRTTYRTDTQIACYMLYYATAAREGTCIWIQSFKKAAQTIEMRMSVGLLHLNNKAARSKIKRGPGPHTYTKASLHTRADCCHNAHALKATVVRQARLCFCKTAVVPAPQKWPYTKSKANVASKLYEVTDTNRIAHT